MPINAPAMIIEIGSNRFGFCGAGAGDGSGAGCSTGVGVVFSILI
jgi:hypothetical protein